MASLRRRLSVAVGCGETHFACRKRLCTRWHRIAEVHSGDAREQHKRCRRAHPGLDFRNVLGDALRAERGLARRLSRVTRRSSRHRVRPELVHLLRGSSGATVRSRVGRGDDIARSAHLLRPAGHGASDPVTPGALPTLEQWADSITAVLDDLGSREAVLVAIVGAFATAALFAATHPSRTTALVVLEGLRRYAGGSVRLVRDEVQAASVGMWGTGEIQHVLNPDMPWNEEIRATWARHERLAASPRTVALMMPLVTELDVRAVLPTIRVPTLVSSTPTTRSSRPRRVSTSPSTYRARNTLRCRAATVYHFVEPWRASFQEIAEFLTGHQAEVADDRVLATVLFTDIVDSTRRAAEMGDRDWHALA